MRRISCRICGKVIDASGSVTLCDQCRSALAKDNVVKNRTCRACGALFSGGPRAWYCPACRAERAKLAEASYRARLKAGQVRKIGSKDICIVCGKPYIVDSSNQRYCPECSEGAVKEIDRAQGKAWMSEHRSESQQKKSEYAKGRRVCKVCGSVFYSTKPTVTCSDFCAKVLKSYRQSKADAKRRGSEPKSIEEIKKRLMSK